MSYEIRWSERSASELEKLDKKIARRIIEKVISTSGDPFSFIKRMKGPNLYKLRVGDYRVIMSVERNKMIIFVIEIGHRSTVYRRFGS